MRYNDVSLFPVEVGGERAPSLGVEVVGRIVNQKEVVFRGKQGSQQ